jgi:hypothetical protein
MMIGLKKFMCSDKYCQSDVTKKLLKAMELRFNALTPGQQQEELANKGYYNFSDKL